MELIEQKTGLLREFTIDKVVIATPRYDES